MDERTLEYGSNIREDFYRVLYHVLVNHGVHLRAMPGFAAQTAEQQRGMKVALDNFADVIVNLAFVPSSRMGEVNPVHRPVVEELMADLQAMLDKMPTEEIAVEASEEQATQPRVGPYQLQRISDGVVFDVLGTKTEPSFVDAVFLTYAEGSLAGKMFGFGRAVLENEFIAYPPQEKPDMSAASTKFGTLLGGTKRPKDIFSLYDGV